MRDFKIESIGLKDNEIYFICDYMSALKIDDTDQKVSGWSI